METNVRHNPIDANDPSLHTWAMVPENSHFPIQNLPFGVFCRKHAPAVRIGVAIGDSVLDVSLLAEADLLSIHAASAFREPTLNRFFSLGHSVWRDTRQRISLLLRADNPTLRDDEPLRRSVLVPQSQVEMLLPAAIGDYTDFYSSKEHATNVGTMLRGADNALQPNL